MFDLSYFITTVTSARKSSSMAHTLFCEKCNKQYICRYSAETDAKTYYCELCNKTTRTRRGLKLHLKTHEELCSCPVKHECDFCGERFSLEARLKEHVVLQHGEKPYSCEQCDKRYTAKKHLDRHRLVHGDKKFECGQCGKRFFLTEQLRAHSVVHEEKTFPCNVCGKMFPSKSRLTQHAVVHGDRKFVCDLCGKEFPHSAELKVHSLVHSDERPFKCNLCDYSCKRKADLKRHYKAHLKGTARLSFLKKEVNSKSLEEDVPEDEVGYIRCPFKRCHRRFLNPDACEMHCRAEHLNVKKMITSLNAEDASSGRSDSETEDEEEEKDTEVYVCTGCSRQYRGGDRLRCHACILYKTNSNLFFPFNTENKRSNAVPVKRISTVFNAHIAKSP